VGEHGHVTRPEHEDFQSLRPERTPAKSGAEAAAAPDLYAIHHVTVPVGDVVLSSDWYASVLDLDCIMVFEQEERVEEAVLAHPGGLVLHLVAAPERAAGLAGFDLMALDVGEPANLQRWERRLDDLGITHTPIRPAHLGWSLAFPDPSGIRIALHTREQPSADEG
jgi:catechol 2,3-dioxygenase-like lactoylglutathione lyase family enzyme